MLDKLLLLFTIAVVAVFVASVVLLLAGTLLELREAGIADDDAAHAARVRRASAAPNPWKARTRDLTADELAELAGEGWD